MATNKIVFLQHDLTRANFSGTYNDDESYTYNGTTYNNIVDFFTANTPGSATAKSAFPVTRVHNDVNSAKTAMGVDNIDSYTEADSITWTLNDAKTELTMTAQFTHPTTSVADCISFQSKIESRNPWALQGVYQDFDKSEYTL
jgi:hypothetical protein